MKDVQGKDPIVHVDRGDAGAFVIERDGLRIAELTYTLDADGTPVVNHTFVAKALRGRGIAFELVKAAAVWAERRGTPLAATCSYARSVLAEHPELGRDVLAAESAAHDRG